MERSGLTRSTIPTLGMIAVVVACGAGGMLLAKHFHQPEAALPQTVAVTAPTQSDAPARSAPAAGPTVPEPTASEAAGRGTSDRVSGSAPVERPDTLPPALARVPGRTPGEVEEDGEVELALRRWQRGLLSNDAEKAAPSYATKVSRYFLRSDVSRAFVRDYMRGEQARGVRLVRYDLSQVSIDHVGHNAVDVHFVAAFTVKMPSGERTGGTRTLLKLHREDGDWKIYYERDYNS